jgi:hypothetical protein
MMKWISVEEFNSSGIGIGYRLQFFEMNSVGSLKAAADATKCHSSTDTAGGGRQSSEKS